jgi:hypothetical protein
LSKKSKPNPLIAARREPLSARVRNFAQPFLWPTTPLKVDISTWRSRVREFVQPSNFSVEFKAFFVDFYNQLLFL